MAERVFSKLRRRSKGAKGLRALIASSRAKIRRGICDSCGKRLSAGETLFGSCNSCNEELAKREGAKGYPFSSARPHAPIG